ncbi:hypothetical protein BC826DRAFT_591621 [Russula brevipes]|nr:hypothetical protein BC826DRAFT_591621 [Russula brevipes]
MSSAEEDINDPDAIGSRTAKKRRVQRACDVCRRKKIRCDGSQMPGNKCSNCSAYNFECKYEEAAKKRGPPKGYVESLESRLEKMENLMQRLCPDADFTQELGAPIDRQSFVRDSLSRSLQNKPGTASYRPPSQLCGGALTSLDDTGDHDLEPSDDEYLNPIAKVQSLQETFNELNVSYRFFGKSSGAGLVQTALDLKSDYSGTEQDHIRMRMANRRPEFWAQHPWERTAFHLDVPRYTFPEPDLMDQLVDLYFSRFNLYLPLIHRPTFERHLHDNLHLRDQTFGSVLLCLCACASRYSDDPRVLLEDSTTTWHSSGWKWFGQVQILRRSLMGPPTLYDVQMYALASLFLQGCSAPQSSWTLIGIGIRLVQDVGKHRKRAYGTIAQTEAGAMAPHILGSRNSGPADERVTRSAVCNPGGRVRGCLFGYLVGNSRRVCISFDVDLPTEVDDEYWENEQEPESAFKQPTGKPSLLSYFVALIKLFHILAIALRTIYSINKSKIFLGFVGPHWEQHIVAELDSALNEWVDKVPGHLKWDTTGQNFRDLRWFLQSASLYSHYYHLQILVHRPFIPSPRKPSPLSFPSLAICTNAARSCAHVVDLQRRRAPQYSFFAFPGTCFSTLHDIPERR